MGKKSKSEKEINNFYWCEEREGDTELIGPFESENATIEDIKETIEGQDDSVVHEEMLSCDYMIVRVVRVVRPVTKGVQLIDA